MVWDVKRTVVLEMKARVSVYLIIILVIHLYFAINELLRDVKQYSINQSLKFLLIRSLVPGV